MQKIEKVNYNTPVILFTYNRPWHTQKVLDALSLNFGAEETEIFIFIDGIKIDESYENLDLHTQVRKIARSECRFKKINVIERGINFGLSKSIIDGVNQIINIHGKVIVLEDDIVPSIGFLKYMNQALQMYIVDESVGCIHGWNYTFNYNCLKNDTFFLYGADCWGWATWERSWKLFNPNAKFLLDSIKRKKLEYIFNRRGTHNFVEMLENRINGKNDSWAVCWHASLLLANKYCLHPSKPIVKNIGLDGSGIHSGDSAIKQNVCKEINLKRIPIEENEVFFRLYRNYKWKKNIKFKINKSAKIIKNHLNSFLNF